MFNGSLPWVLSVEYKAHLAWLRGDLRADANLLGTWIHDYEPTVA